MSTRLFCRIVTIVTLCLLGSTAALAQAQPAAVVPESITVEGLARQLSITQQQLQQTQDELQRLLNRDQQRQEWEQTVIRRLPPADVSWEQASYGSVYSGEGACDECCPDCGETVCQGMPHLCDECLEGLSWNKKGGWRIVPFGMLRGELIYSQQEQAADAIIFFLAPDAVGVDDDQFTAHGKTSMLNFAVTGPDIGSWQTGGAIVMNFTGSQPLRNTSGPNVLNAYGELKNDYWRFSFGRMFDLFGPINPSTVNMGQQRAAGNIGIYRGAMQLDRYITFSEESRMTISGRLSQNTVNDYLLLPTARGVDNGFPNIEGRIGLEFGPERDGQRAVEMGISGLWGETRAFDPARFLEDDEGGDPIFFLPPVQEVSTTAGGCFDWQLRGERFGFVGEFWVAQAAGTYFVGVLQTLNPVTGRGIRSIGGWGEVYYKWNECTTFHVGYGIDDPRNQDVGFITTSVNDPGQRTSNEVLWVNVKRNVTDFFELGFEVSYRETDYLNPLVSDDGVLFHFSSSLIY